MGGTTPAPYQPPRKPVAPDDSAPVTLLPGGIGNAVGVEASGASSISSRRQSPKISPYE